MADTEWELDAVLVGPDDISGFNEDNILPQSDENISKIRKWLHPTSYNGSDSEYVKHLSSHLAGTGAWLLSSPTYKEWHSSQTMGLLWIRGVPGSGKSVMSATLVNSLSLEKVPVLYFFFRQIIDANHTPLAAIRDWLCQILAFSPPLQVRLLQYIKEYRSLDSISTADFWSLLRNAISHLPKVYCVVDALDEIDHGPEMVSFISSLADLGIWQPSKVKTILTSRPVHNVEIHLRRAKLLNIRLDEAEVDVDIATYVQHQLAASCIPANHHAAIKEAVPGRANGLFLYARLAMDAFLEPGADPQRVLQELPTDLNVMYTDLLREHRERSGVSHEVQLLILQWVTHATRPLRLLELAESIHIMQCPEGQRNLKAAKILARSACGPLVEVLPDETISVVHHSLTEFLNGSTRTPDIGGYPILEYGPTHNRLALLCLAHLQSDCFGNMDEIVKRGRRSYDLPPFTKYAMENWHVHARKADIAGVDQTEVNAAIDKFWNGEHFGTWAAFVGIGWRKITPLFAAVSIGLRQYVKTLLLQTGTSPKKGDMDEPPLHCAAHRGYDEIVGLLLQHGADIHEGDEDGYYALHAAAENNHANVITLLLQAGADPFCEPGECHAYHQYGPDPSGTPISKACQNGHLEAMSAFWPYIRTSEQVHEALSEAVEHGRSAIVEFLLMHPEAKVDALFPKHTLLYLACCNRDPTTIKLLLAAGANPNLVYDDTEYLNKHGRPDGLGEVPPGRGYTALYALSNGGNVVDRNGPSGGGPWRYRDSVRFDESDARPSIEAFKLMLDAGANVHQLDSKGNTALAYTYDIVAMRCLLKAGADPTVSNYTGKTLLHGHNNLEILRIILETTSLDVNSKSKRSGQTPLLHNLSKIDGYEDDAAEKAMLLLEFGADASTVDDEGNGAFHLLAGISSLRDGEVASRLIHALKASGADGNIVNDAGDTPLHTLGSDGFVSDVFSTVVSAGLDTEAKDRNGCTPLFKAMDSKEKECILEEILDPMLKAGCSVHTFDSRGRNLLFPITTSKKSRKAKIFSRLIDLGLNPKHTDNDGNTLWHAAVTCRYRRDLRDELVGFGVDPDRPNIRGQTPLHLICSRPPWPSNYAYSWHRIPYDPDSPEIFDKFVTLVTNIDAVDKDGVTPLHLATTSSEYQTKRLLRIGADCTKKTREGLTVLHIAARSRQANNIGIIMDHFTHINNKDNMRALVNAKDKLGRMALWYACASGCIESVKMLIEAGATVETETYEASPWEGCVEFEKEQETWRSGSVRYSQYSEWIDYASVHTYGTLISDHERPYTRIRLPGRESPCYKIDDIVELLATYQSNARKLLPQAISSAAKLRHAYTADCLVRAKESINPNVIGLIDPPTGHEPMLEPSLLNCLKKRRAEDEAALESSSDKSDEPTRFEKLLALRGYKLAAENFSETDCLKVKRDGRTILHRLAQQGHASILARVCSLDMTNKLEDIKWCKQQYPVVKLRSLLVDAVTSFKPNMDVVRVLVEEIGVDVNGQTRCWTSRRSPLDDEYVDEYVKDEGALHRIFKHQEWWQMSQALPYLVANGADLNIRDQYGSTPLQIALSDVSVSVYDMKNIELLVSLGADVNPGRSHFTTCLGKALDHMETAEFLVQHGARVTYWDIITAMEKHDSTALEFLLRKGGDPNGREFAEPEYEDQGRERQLKEGPIYLLERAVRNVHDAWSDVIDSREKLVDILVAHGADLNARYEDTTLMHRILRLTYNVRNLLRDPSLDVNLQDAEGRTLLHTACNKAKITATSENDPSPDEFSYVEILLSRGANVLARDKTGKNALHWLFQARGREFAFHATNQDSTIPDPRAVSAILARAPELIGQADEEGNTPLHKACSDAIDHVGVLLDMGADPLAVNAKGATPLHYLICGSWEAAHGVKVEGPRYELFRRFLAMGADINARDAHGETPLFHFCRVSKGVYYEPKSEPPNDLKNDDPRWEKALYNVFEEVGVDWKVANKDGDMLLHIVAARHVTEDRCISMRRCGWRPGTALQRFKWLVGLGLDVMAENGKQKSPLDVAADYNVSDILALFKRKTDA